MTDYEIDIIEIKETLKKMQEDLKRIENNIPFYQTTYLEDWQSCSTQACNK